MKYLYLNKYWEINKEYNLDKLLYLMIDRPKYINVSDYFWLNDKKQIHRDYDLPSNIDFFIDEDTDDEDICYLYWYLNNKRHRKNNKPAVINSDGDKSYWINDNFIKDE